MTVWDVKRNHQWGPESIERTTDILILDNRDSFVFNLAHRFYEAGREAKVLRSDAVDVDEIAELSPKALVISPGPGHPDDAGCSVEAIRRFAGEIPILGVCLGHQAIAVAFGGRVEPGGRPMHGMASHVDHDGTGVFQGLDQPFEAGRYHSLVITDCPDELVPNAWVDGFVMGVRHRTLPVHGVQFHPESVLTPAGRAMLANFGQAAG